MSEDWRTDAPPQGVDIELVTDAGAELTGQVSFVKSVPTADGRKRSLYQLRDGRRGVFGVVRWRRVGAGTA